MARHRTWPLVERVVEVSEYVQGFILVGSALGSHYLHQLVVELHEVQVAHDDYALLSEPSFGLRVFPLVKHCESETESMLLRGDSTQRQLREVPHSEGEVKVAFGLEGVRLGKGETGQVFLFPRVQTVRRVHVLKDLAQFQVKFKDTDALEPGVRERHGA